MIVHRQIDVNLHVTFKFVALVDYPASTVCPSVNFFSLSPLLQTHGWMFSKLAWDVSLVV